MEDEFRVRMLEKERQLREEHRRELQRRTGALHAQHQETLADLQEAHAERLKTVRQSVVAAESCPPTHREGRPSPRLMDNAGIIGIADSTGKPTEPNVRYFV